MQSIVNQILDVFTDLNRVTKSHILIVNAFVQIDVPIRQSINEIANESKLH